MPRIAVVHVDPPTMRSAGLVEALRQRAQVVGVLQPRIGSAFDVANKLRHFATNRDSWRARAYFNKARFDRYSRSIAEQLAEVDHDLVLHTYPILFTAPHDSRYGIFTDNTMAITQRAFPVWANLTPKERKRMIDSERDSFRAAQFVGVQGMQARVSAVEDYGCDQDRVEVVGQGVMLPIPEVYPVRPADDPPTALFVATTFDRKGGDILLAAWRTVTDTIPSARMRIVGPKGRRPPNLPPTCDWLGPLPRAALIAHYEAADVLVHPTKFEASLPNVIREAMVHGLPVVASDVPAIRESFPGPEWLVRPDDADGFSERVIRLLSDRSLAESTGRTLHEARTRFSWERMADRVLALAERTNRG